MKFLAISTVSALALIAAGCSQAPKARTALDCPQAEGGLTRTGASADGKSCTYVTADGAEVSLRLLAVSATPDATLKAVEDELLAGRTPKTEDEKSKASDIAKDAEKVANEALADAGVDGKVKVDLKNGHGVVVSDEDGGKVHVNLPGIHVTADEKDDSARVQVGPININAGEDGATVKMKRDVRLRGQALSREKRGLRAMFIYSGKDLPGGYRFVGYEAGGPKAGPLAVATVRSKEETDDIYSDVKTLVRRNGGV